MPHKGNGMVHPGCCLMLYPWYLMVHPCRVRDGPAQDTSITRRTIQSMRRSILGSIKHVVVYENISEEFDIDHCLMRVKVTAFFSPFTTIQTVKSCISAVAHNRKLCLRLLVHYVKIYKIY